jgi:hypothetical protein
VQRRRRILQRYESGDQLDHIADAMGISTPRAGRYLEEAKLARDLDRHRCESVPAQLIRDLYDRRHDEDPTLSIRQLAIKAKLDRGTVAAAIGGAAETPPSAEDLVGVEVAARIVQALDFAPHEVPGL